ncbi:MAG: penicillin-binding protein 2 [Anaerolineales bacterium]|nr:penicillin-binding protein 2 [Anaerolineales bacterium]
MTRTTTPSRFQGGRFLTIYIVIGLVFAVFLSRLFNLQILQGVEWTTQAEKNRTRQVSLPPARGIIYDRNGIVLARNVASYNIVITPAYLPDDDSDIQRIYRELSQLIAVPVNQGTLEETKLISPCTLGPGITQLVALGESLAPYEQVKISCNVSEGTALTVRERALDWPGVSIEIEPVRDYTTGSLTANLVGFLGPIPAILEQDYREQGFSPGRDKVGYAGVEASLDSILIGTPGKRVIEVDVAGKELGNLQPPVAPVAGDNMMLTIDTRLQAAAQAALVGEIDSWNEWHGYLRITSGVVIAMNPKTGEILAMVSYPTYENNRMARFIPTYYYQQLSQDPRHPLLNTAISATYPPGSAFKLSTATGALNEGVVTLDQIIDAPGKLTLVEKFSPTDPGNERDYVDWNEAGFGKIDFLHCIAFSSNVCFYKLGGGYKDEIPEGLGILRLKQYARALGYDQPSGVELFGEASGLIPDPTWKRINKGENWSTGDTYIAGVGQGYVASTPIQVLMSAATIANNGKLMQPTIIKAIIDGAGNIVPMWRDEQINFYSSPVSGSWQMSPFQPHARWDITTDPIIKDYRCEGGYCSETGLMKTVQPWVVSKIQEGMRLAVTDARGTLHRDTSFLNYPIAVAGKTGSAEYCDDVALAQNRCKFGLWPVHSWTVAYAPFDDPEIVIVAFAYNAGEGASVAAPIIKLVMDAYFEIKAINIAQGISGGQQQP